MLPSIGNALVRLKVRWATADTGLFKQFSDNEGFKKRLIEREYYTFVPPPAYAWRRVFHAGRKCGKAR